MSDFVTFNSKLNTNLIVITTFACELVKYWPKALRSMFSPVFSLNEQLLCMQLALVCIYQFIVPFRVINFRLRPAYSYIFWIITNDLHKTLRNMAQNTPFASRSSSNQSCCILVTQYLCKLSIWICFDTRILRSCAEQLRGSLAFCWKINSGLIASSHCLNYSLTIERT